MQNDPWKVEQFPPLPSPEILKRLTINGQLEILAFGLTWLCAHATFKFC